MADKPDFAQPGGDLPSSEESTPPLSGETGVSPPGSSSPAGPARREPEETVSPPPPQAPTEGGPPTLTPEPEASVPPLVSATEFSPPSSPASPAEPEPSAPFPPGDTLTTETPPTAPPPGPPSPEVTPSPTPGEPSPTELIIEKSERGPNLKKFLPFLLLFLILGGLVFAGIKLLQNRQLPGLPVPVGQEVSLTYWGLWEPETVFNTIISEYQQAHPKVKINYVQHSPKDYRQRLQSALARGEGPDIFRFHNTWVPMLKKDLSSLPASIMNSATFESLYYPVVRRDLRVGNNYVGIPLEIDGLALFINEEIFESGGKTLPTQVTWDELRKLACELTLINEQGQIEIAGAALGKTENVDHWSDILALMMLQNGAEMSQPTDLSAQQALRYFVMYGQKTAECPRTWDETLPASPIAFAQGKVAMFFGSSWRIFEVKDMNPNLRFRVIPVPQLPETNLTWASYWVEGVAQGSKSQEEAWRFVKYLSEKETMEKLFQAETQLAPSRIAGEPYSRMDMAELLEGDPYVGAFISQAPVAESWYLASRTFDNGLNDLMIAALEEAVTQVGEGKPLDQALEIYSQKVGQLLSQYQISPSVVR